MSEKTPNYTIVFGDAATSFAPRSLYQIHDEQVFFKNAPYGKLLVDIDAEHVAILQQTHSTAGYAASRDHLIAPYTKEGDFLITNEPGIALCVATADCAPVVITSTTQPALAVIHAGWRGTHAGIIERAVIALGKAYGCTPDTLTLTIGPTGRSCCYEVQEDFPLWGSAGSERRESKNFFDLPTNIALRAYACGIPQHAISLENGQCTICSQEYCSFRRDGETSQRQITIGMITNI